MGQSHQAMIKNISVSPDPTLSEKYGKVGGSLFMTINRPPSGTFKTFRNL